MVTVDIKKTSLLYSLDKSFFKSTRALVDLKNDLSRLYSKDVFFISTVTKKGLDELLNYIMKIHSEIEIS